MSNPNTIVLDLNQEIEADSLSLLRLEKFRNIRELDLTPHSQFNFFYGDNAQGKTSILEAIYFLSELRSFRTSELESLISHQEEQAILSAQLDLLGLSYELKAKISHFEKKILVNEKIPKPYRRLRKILPVVLFTPDSVRLFRLSPSHRRDYFDHFFGILSESFLVDVVDYGRIIKQKQRLIEEAKAFSRILTLKELEVWNEKLVKIGGKIIRQRFDFTKELSCFFSLFFKRLSGSDWEMNFRYQPYLTSVKEDSTIDQIQNLLWEEIEKRFADEMERGQLLVGAHRDDWVSLLNKINLREEGSQGQHRIAVAALKLAEVEMMKRVELHPIALFDDLLSELDETRNLTVLETLEENRAQVFLTSITPPQNSLKRLEGKIFKLVQGRVIAS